MFRPRILKFKAWNLEDKILVRLSSIDCNRGELVKKNHVLLQFTGIYDKQGEEIYDMDIVLKGVDRYVVRWDVDLNGWFFSLVATPEGQISLTTQEASTLLRLCSYFEIEK